MLVGGVPNAVTIFAGRFGSGKTETAINYSLALINWLADSAGQEPSGLRRPPATNASCRDGVILVDLDIVTPYFRSREMAEAMQRRGVQVIAPSVIGQHLDTPAITPQILGAIQQSDRYAVLDVGGDRQGARALGGFSPAIAQRDYTLHFVLNPYRPFTRTLDGVRASIREIEQSARLQVTSLVSNPNLMGETAPEHILQGHANVERFAEALDLPIAFVCLESIWARRLGSNHFTTPTLRLDRFFVQPWEETR